MVPYGVSLLEKEGIMEKVDLNKGGRGRLRGREVWGWGEPQAKRYMMTLFEILDTSGNTVYNSVVN